MASRVGTVFASAARTATPTAVTIDTQGCKGILLFIDETAHASTPSVVFSVNRIDPLSGTKSLILASAAVATEGHTVLKIYPGVTAASNVSVSDIITSQVEVTAVHGNANSSTYSVGYQLIP